MQALTLPPVPIPAPHR